MPAAETPVAYLGIDVGKSSHSACALDAGGGVVFRAELANRPDDIDRLLERAGSGALVVVDQKRNIGALVLAVSVNLFFTSFAKQARRSRKGGFTGCANVFSPIPVTA